MNRIVFPIVVISLLVCPANIFAQSGINLNVYKDSSSSAQQQTEKDLSALQKQARQYRNLGLEAQKINKIDEAMSYYQKAVELDPYYAPLYNDLGVLYESKGLLDKALEQYQKCIDIDPSYEGPYTNLALFYENKGDLKKAAYYWKKRWKMGDASDHWAQKARERLQDISMVDLDVAQELREEQIIALYKDVAEEKADTKDPKAAAQVYFKRAKEKYEAGRFEDAYYDAVAAMELDFSNSEIKSLAEEIQKRVLTK